LVSDKLDARTQYQATEEACRDFFQEVIAMNIQALLKANKMV